MTDREATRRQLRSVVDTRTPRVAHLIDSLGISGGAERQLVANMRSFDHDLIHHDVVLLREAKASRVADLPSSVHTWLLNDGKPTGRIRSALSLHKLVNEQKFDLIHASLPDSALIARMVGLATGTVVVESLVNISHEPIRTVDNPSVTPTKLQLHTWLDRITTARVRRFHAVSDAVAESWSRTVKIDPGRIDVVPRGIDLSEFTVDEVSRAEHRRSVREEFGLNSDAFLVLAVGRQEPQKGHRYLLEAASLLTSRIPDLHVLIVGREALSSQTLVSQVEELDLTNTVTMTGARRDLPRLLAATDIFAFPSLFEGNGGNALMEAMAVGLAIVTTGAAPMTDLVPNERYGILVPPRDAEKLASALARLASEPDLRSRLGDAARERAQGFASPEELARRYEAWYRSILDIQL